MGGPQVHDGGPNLPVIWGRGGGPNRMAAPKFYDTGHDVPAGPCLTHFLYCACLWILFHTLWPEVWPEVFSHILITVMHVHACFTRS